MFDRSFAIRSPRPITDGEFLVKVQPFRTLHRDRFAGLAGEIMIAVVRMWQESHVLFVRNWAFSQRVRVRVKHSQAHQECDRKYG